MAKSLRQYRANIQALIAAIPAFGQHEAEKLAKLGQSWVEDRSVKNGIYVDGQEGNYATYSTNKVATRRFADKVLNSGGRQFIKQYGLATYHDFRIAEGLTNHYVNVSYTNRFWSSQRITRSYKRNNSYVVEFGTSDAQVLSYAKKLRARYGRFTEPTSREKERLLAIAKEDFLTFLKQYL